ncbi:MAG: hypothetical protein EOO77_03815 [Oxalobacteraceae bacterium]|nr:MAG: hypothetical protein EOO77_03815 [Oxalobacteraceae bacterium]
MSGGEVIFAAICTAVAVLFFFAERNRRFWKGMTLDQREAHMLARTGHTLECHYRIMDGYDCTCRRDQQENPA